MPRQSTTTLSVYRRWYDKVKLQGKPHCSNIQISPLSHFQEESFMNHTGLHVQTKSGYFQYRYLSS